MLEIEKNLEELKECVLGSVNLPSCKEGDEVYIKLPGIPASLFSVVPGKV